MGRWTSGATAQTAQTVQEVAESPERFERPPQKEGCRSGMEATPKVVDKEEHGKEIATFVSKADPFNPHEPFKLYDGSPNQALPSEWAELLARLNPDRGPTNLSQNDWFPFVRACRQLADHWATRIAEFEWKPQDVFGYDGRAGLFPYFGRNSLAWLLAAGGYTLISLDEYEAIVGTGAGRQRILRRVAHQLLVWRPEEYLH
jgi:hypothetical protein